MGIRGERRPCGVGVELLTFKVGHERLGDALDLVQAAHENGTWAVGVQGRVGTEGSCSTVDQRKWGRKLGTNSLVASSCEG